MGDASVHLLVMSHTGTAIPNGTSCGSNSTNYHDEVLETLMEMVRPGWKILDIGAGNGVLSLPLCAIGCEGQRSRTIRRYEKLPQ